LPREDVERLFALVGRLRARGVAVVYISHFLEEVRALADDLTVLRDGRTVWTGTVDAISDGEIIGHMVGRDVADLFPARRELDASAPVALRVERFAAPPAVRQADLTVRHGEIL